MNWPNMSRNRGLDKGGRGNRKKSIKNKKNTSIRNIHVRAQGQEKKIERNINEERRRSAKNTEDTTVAILSDTQYIDSYNIKV